MQSKEKRRCVHPLSGGALALPREAGWHLAGVSPRLTPTRVRAGPAGSGRLRPQRCFCPRLQIRRGFGIPAPAALAPPLLPPPDLHRRPRRPGAARALLVTAEFSPRGGDRTEPACSVPASRAGSRDPASPAVGPGRQLPCRAGSTPAAVTDQREQGPLAMLGFARINWRRTLLAAELLC